MRHTRDMGRLAGEVALITGSTSGIGRAIAIRFAQEGAAVIVTGRDRARGHGSIINLSSRAASRASRGIAGYIAAKGALEALTRSIAVDEAPHGVRCNAISPGYVLNMKRDANITPAERARREAMHLIGL